MRLARILGFRNVEAMLAGVSPDVLSQVSAPTAGASPPLPAFVASRGDLFARSCCCARRAAARQNAAHAPTTHDPRPTACAPGPAPPP